MRFSHFVSGILAIWIFSETSVRAGLDVGDSAPPLSITEWVRGDSVDLAGDASKKLHLVEFWATWCPPCKASVPLLSDYQQQYRKDLVIVGVTDPDDRGNTPASIRQFVKRMGSGMDYTVAIDNRSRTSNAYLLAAGAIGIPHAFLVGRDGRILWQGSPLDPALGEVLPKAINGTYDAALERELGKRFQALRLSIEMGQWATVWDGLVEILKMDPGNEVAMDALVNIYAMELRNTRTFRSWATDHIAAHRDNLEAMLRLSQALLRIEDFTTRTPDLAVQAAEAAYQASQKKSPSAIAVYARALYQIGHLDRAIRVQEDAVALAVDTDRPGAQKTLEYYRLCKKLHQSLN